MYLLFYGILFWYQGFPVDCDDKGDTVRYDGYQLWQVNVQGRRLSKDLLEKISSKDVWHTDAKVISFLLNASETNYWERFMESHNISHTVLLKDLQEAIEKESLILNRGSRRGSLISWTSYLKLNEIYSYLKSIADGNPKLCTLQTIGKTVHKKDIKMLKISNGNSTNEPILVEAGMHGREWLAIASVLYFIDNIASNFTSQPNFVQNKDWYIVPVMNPDGYEYTMTKDRMWRKNRRRFSGPCDGVDINRNFDSDWGRRGASAIICAKDYCGPAPFSEQESIALKNLAQSRHFFAYATIHSFGGSVSFPWAFTGNPTADVGAHSTVAKGMAMAMRKVADEHYVSGSVNQLKLVKGSGMAIDWMYRQGIKHCYIIQTRGGHFIVEPSQILPSGQEITAGLKKMAEFF